MKKKKRNIKIHFSSLTDKWKTPKSLFEKLDQEFKFDTDPCPSKKPLKKGLKKGWGKSVFCNPPYSELSKWVEHCCIYSHNIKNKVVIMLIPSRTDTIAFHKYILPFAKEIRFIKGRLKFSGHKNSAPFPSCVVVFKK